MHWNVQLLIFITHKHTDSRYWYGISVCLSVCHVVALCLNESTRHQSIKVFFTLLHDRNTIPSFELNQHSKTPSLSPSIGMLNTHRVGKNLLFLTNITACLWNGTTQAQCHCYHHQIKSQVPDQIVSLSITLMILKGGHEEQIIWIDLIHVLRLFDQQQPTSVW